MKQFVDYTDGTGGDSGYNEPESVEPCLNGENVQGADPMVGYGGVINRPAENLRQRTEAIRALFRDSMYMHDADRGLLLGGPGNVTWPGSTTALASGIPVITDTLYIIPALTPGYAQVAPVPPVASTYGTITLLKADSNDGIVVTSARRSAERGDQINITVVAGGSLSAVLTDPEERSILLTVAPTDTLSAIMAALVALSADSPPTQLVTCALAGGAANGDFLLDTQAKQYMAGNVDGEAHAITPANLASFFVSNPTHVLAEGDTLGIWYDQVYESGGTGGRRQSTPENSNTAVPAASFFNSRMSPEKIVNGIPICKVINNRLVFVSGVQVPAAVTNYSLVGTNAASVTYAGGSAWYDTTTNPATTVEAQLDKIITDLIATANDASGADRIAVDAETYGFASRSAESIKARMNAIEAAKANIGFANTFAATQTFDAPDETESAGFAWKTADAPVSTYKPLGKFPIAGSKYVRWFISSANNGEFVITVNAKWDETGALWSRDAAGNSAFYGFSRDTFYTQHRTDTGVSWASNAWTTSPLTMDMDGTMMTFSGDLASESSVTTPEADVRHGNKTQNVHGAHNYVGGTAFEFGDSGHYWTIAAGSSGTLVFPLPVTVGDRIVSAKVYVKSAVGTLNDIVVTLQEVVVAAPATYTVSNVGTGTPGNAANTNIQLLDPSPAAPYTVLDGAAYQMLVQVPGTTAGKKHVYHVQLVTDRIA